MALADLAGGILDPVLRRRAGLTIELVQSWDEIAGAALAPSTRPEKIAWPKRASQDDRFEPGTLVVAAEGFAALRLQHETGELIGRVNAFFGYPAVSRVRIVQKPVARQMPKRKPAPVLDRRQEERLDRTIGGIEDEPLRAALERLGRSVIGRRGG